jgi:hypothetical protein
MERARHPPKVVFPTKEACLAEASELVSEEKAAKAKMERAADESEREHPGLGRPILLEEYNLTWKCSEMKKGGQVITGP